MRIGQPKLSERKGPKSGLFAPIDVDPGVISKDENSNLKVGVNSAFHAGLSAVHSGDSLRPLPRLTNRF